MADYVFFPLAINLLLDLVYILTVIGVCFYRIFFFLGFAIKGTEGRGVVAIEATRVAAVVSPYQQNHHLQHLSETCLTVPSRVIWRIYLRI